MYNILLTASGYDWTCETCGACNHLSGIPDVREIKCPDCGTEAFVDDWTHAYEK
jgi:DNA-directed RNA polymerase subunit RPC12/RpoP